MNFPKPYADTVARLRVPSGFLLIVLFASLSDPTAQSLMAGVPVSLAGLAIRAWAAGHLAKNMQLADRGPYALVRNPLYIGTALLAAGLVIATRSVTIAAVSAVVFLFVYLPVIQLEEQHLRSLFPEYGDYARRVPMLLPLRGAAGALGGWQSRLYLKNEEWKAALGYAAGLAFLIIRATW